MQEKQRAQDAQRTATGTRGLLDAEGGALAKGTPATVDAEGDLEGMGEAIKAAFEGDAQRTRRRIIDRARRDLGDGVTIIDPQTIQDLKELTDSVRGSFTEVVNSDAFKALKKNLEAIKESQAAFAAYMEQHRDEWQTMAEAADYIWNLAPFIETELSEAQRHDPALQGITLDDLIDQCFDVAGNKLDSPLLWVVERAEQRKAGFDTAAGTIAEIEQAAEELPRVKYKKITELKTVTDKLASVFFSLLAPASSGAAIDGQRQMTPLRYEGQKSKKEITLFYDYVYNEEVLKRYGIVKKFDDFDFLVMTIIDALKAAGNDVVSFTKIFKEMGGDDKPTAKQLEPIYYSLLKGLTTIITIDDAEVQKAWKSGTYHEIVSPVIPVQLGNERFIASGKIAKGYVKINSFSPFMQVAQPLGHLTAWNKDILRLYSRRKTKRYYSVIRFLMMHIGWMRNGSRSHKILYSTLYDHTGDTTTRARQLARNMMYDLLDKVFIPTGYVKSYKEEGGATPGVVLTLSKRPTIEGNQK